MSYESQVEMMKKFLEEKKQKNSSGNSNSVRPPKSSGKANTKQNSSEKIGNGGSTFDK